MKKFKDIVLVIFVLSLSVLIFSCGKKTTEPETKKVATPTFSHRTGAYEGVQYVTINCSTKGATILYTTDGSMPDSSSLAYTTPIIVGSNITIIAQAFKDDWIESDISSVSYTINPNLDGMIFVPGGDFLMGDTRQGGNYSEQPTHIVTLNPFYIGKYEVTQGEYETIMGINPACDCGVGENYPVYDVNWFDAIKYCNLRSITEDITPVYSINGSNNPDDWGEIPEDLDYDPTWDTVICNWDADGYRLPTEAEWEYAARGAANYPDYLYSGSDYLDLVAWNYENSDLSTHPVGKKIPNGLGIHDMSGNVMEWCWDWYYDLYYSISPLENPTGPESGISRVMRGGSWNTTLGCRVAWRDLLIYQFGRVCFVGFRVCRSVN